MSDVTANINSVNIGQKLLDVPFGDMVESMAMGIAEAQARLDENSTYIALLMSGVDPEDKVDFSGQKYSLLELGFTPTFYQFVDTIIEVKMAISMSVATEDTLSERVVTNSKTKSRRGGWFSRKRTRTKTATTTTVDSSYSQKFNYTAEGSSLMRTKLVPVPPPVNLTQTIQNILAEQAAPRVVPSTTGISNAQEYVDLLSELGISYTLSDPEADLAGTTSFSVNPTAGTVLTTGQTVTVTV